MSRTASLLGFGPGPGRGGVAGDPHREVASLSSSRPILRRLSAAMLAVGLLAALMTVPTSAATTAVTGTLSYAESVTLTPNAVAVVTIVDQTASPDAGAIVGEEWIGAPTTVPIDFSVLIDSATLDPTHAYALFATITDGANVWQNPHGEPVITGGPVSGIALVLPAVPATAPASISGTIVPPADAAFGPGAVEIAALVKVETGTLVTRQVRPITGPTDLAFTIGFDPALIDPTASYVVKGGIVDGAAVWENKDGVPAIKAGKAGGPVSLSVTRVATDLPVVSPAPSPFPSGSAEPSGSPSGEPSGEPSASPSESASPSSTPGRTARPTATPTPTPTRPRRRPRRRLRLRLRHPRRRPRPLRLRRRPRPRPPRRPRRPPLHRPAPRPRPRSTRSPGR